MAQILIVDDSPTEILRMAGVLRDDGHLVTEANSAEEAVGEVAQNLPDLIVMDVVLPGMSGFQATRKIHRAPGSADIPVILVSVKNMESDRLWGLRQGASEYVFKPFTDQALLDAVHRQLPDRVA